MHTDQESNGKELFDIRHVYEQQYETKNIKAEGARQLHQDGIHGVLTARKSIRTSPAPTLQVCNSRRKLKSPNADNAQHQPKRDEALIGHLGLDLEKSSRRVCVAAIKES